MKTSTVLKKFSMTAVGAALSTCIIAAPKADAAVVSLGFEGLKDMEQILNFYNGGTGSLGSAGPNYGISFGPDSLALIDFDNGGNGNFANEPTPNTVAFFLTGPGNLMNVAAGFDTGFSFYYSSSQAGSVTVFDGLNGTGTQLAQINLGVNFQNNNCTGDPTGMYCNWDPIGVSFAGTAKSVLFAGTANQVGFDNITLGSNTPRLVSVPEPSSLFGLLAVGFLGVGSVLKPKLK
jgi:hypothetical protein